MQHQKDKIAISVKNLYGIYNLNKERQNVSISNVSFDFESNKIYFLVGNSGSGKSTLVNHFNGLLKSRFGNIVINNQFKIGTDWFIDNYSIGILDKKTIDSKILNKINKSKNSHLFVVNSKYPKFFIKVLFQSLYKATPISVKFIKNEKNNFIYQVIINDKDFDYEINPNLNYKNLQNNAKNKMNYFNFLTWYIFKNKKIKKIKKLRKVVGLVFQFPEYQLFKDTVEKDIMFGPIVLGEKPEIAKQKAKKYLNLLGLGDEYLYHSPFELSGGQKRRVAIAGILAIEPNILVFDEPTAGLDPQGEIEILNIIKKAKNNNQTIIVISHNMDHALEIADEVIVMNDGEIIASGNPFDIFMDKELIEYTKLEKPKIIDFIDLLIEKNDIYNKILTIKPTNIDDLVSAIESCI